MNQDSSGSLEDIEVVPFSHSVRLWDSRLARIILDEQIVTRGLKFAGSVRVEHANLLWHADEVSQRLSSVKSTLRLDGIEVPQVSECVLDGDGVAITGKTLHLAILGDQMVSSH